MTTIQVTRTAIIDAPLAAVWAQVRDFNSHIAWHPAIAESHIEAGEAADHVGCVRNFRLKDGHHIREQLLALSDRDHVSTYCILEATLPMQRYVATVRLSRVTDGDRTFWHWQSSFDVPAGREAEFERLVGDGVYVGGFDGIRAFLRRGGQPATRAIHAAGVRVSAGSDLPGEAMVLRAHGGPEQFKRQAVQAAPPGPGEVRLRQTAIGVNFIDVYIRRGDYRMVEPPAVIGMEAAGVVVDVGPGVSHLLPGDRVAYACLPPGSYASVRTLAADQVVVLPADLDDETAAALMLKGLSAEYLLHRTCRVGPGDVILVHAAAGGLGLMLCRWASRLGARVLGTVSTEAKARLARDNGCADVFVTPDYRFSAAVLAATRGRGVDIIYDGLGREAFEENLAAVATTGRWISYGQASGALDAVPMAMLSARSITLTRPVLFHYTAERDALRRMAANVFAAWRDGMIRADIHHRYRLAEAATAHRALDSRATTGQIVLRP